MTQSVSIQIPKLTMATTEVTFVEWLVPDGTTVEEDEAIYSVATDKVENEIAAPAAGVLRHGTAESEEVYPVGTEIGTIERANG
ncbi:biotin/lipoyl-containing protein [Cryptosporangium phraense]|uniref:Biotin-requiring enzyme family protein n=1 Tax=Cryptosporangium phraense TaxID=2593070 RepID=A0A545B095_9ACTN|nr:biotin/lipoyl-containing protein [Cryptosporangium phraense]TQS47006.1 biotin-requiring enzyme family protein [Cryptosporangium phraense]